MENKKGRHDAGQKKPNSHRYSLGTKNRKGEIYVTVCIFVLVIVTVFSVILSYASVITNVNVQKTNTEIVFDSFVANNSIIIYNNIKQGKNATDGVRADSFHSSLKQFCTLDARDGKWYSLDADGTEKYSMTVPQIGYTKVETLELYASFTMYVPIRFAGRTVTTAVIPVTVTSALTSKN